MKKIAYFLDELYDSHPYLTIILLSIGGSFVGILIEYMINGDFIPSALYSVLFFNVIWMLTIKMKRLYKKKKQQKR